ncbi:hypothetical protein [Undibacterium sp. TJN25]|uniref:hypothetical protein n=1 Tax=Undibacterium sp. TJN25 TaxID=3413056 RepID=UPI003BF5533C
MHVREYCLRLSCISVAHLSVPAGIQRSGNVSAHTQCYRLVLPFQAIPDDFLRIPNGDLAFAADLHVGTGNLQAVIAEQAAKQFLSESQGINAYTFQQTFVHGVSPSNVGKIILGTKV